MSRHELVIHPERYIRRLVEVNLQRQGYRVSLARDLSEALARASSDPPDLVLIDERRERLIAALAAHPATRDVRVMVVGAPTSEFPPPSGSSR